MTAADHSRNREKYAQGVRKLLTPKWLALHALAVLLILAFLGLGYWQLKRGEAGNARSLGYAFQWPAFALFVVYMWIRMAREELHPHANAADEEQAHVVAPTADAPATARYADETDEDDDPEADAELEEYNRWLAELNGQAERASR